MVELRLFGKNYTLGNSLATKTDAPVVLSIPWLNEAMEAGQYIRDKLTTETDAYKKVPLCFRAIKLRCDTLTGIPITIFKDGEETDQYPFESTIPLRKLIWQIEASLLLAGRSACVKLVNESDEILGLQYLNPFTLEVKHVVDQRTGQITLTFRQFVNGKWFPNEPPYYWTQDEMLFFKEFSPSDDVATGVSATQVALGNTQLNHYLTRFIGHFFESGAMPVTLMVLDKDTTEDEVKRVEGKFKQVMTGLRNAFRIIGIKGDKSTVNTISPELKSMDIKNLDSHTIDNLSWAYDVPKSILIGEAANYATIEQEYKIFLLNTIIPRARMMESNLNAFLSEFGYEIKFNEGELHALQKDEGQRSMALTNLVNAGIPTLVAMEMLGYEIPDQFKAVLAQEFGYSVDEHGNIEVPELTAKGVVVKKKVEAR